VLFFLNERKRSIGAIDRCCRSIGAPEFTASATDDNESQPRADRKKEATSKRRYGTRQTTATATIKQQTKQRRLTSGGYYNSYVSIEGVLPHSIVVNGVKPIFVKKVSTGSAEQTKQ
jgi:hypothetical protein